MDWLLLIPLMIGTWATLSLLGSERDRRSRTLDYHLTRLAAEAAKSNATSPTNH